MNKKTKALTTEQYKEIIQTMKEVCYGNLQSQWLRHRPCPTALQHSFAAVTQRYIGIEPQRIEAAIQGHAQLL